MNKLIEMYQKFVGEKVDGKKSYLLLWAILGLVIFGGMESPAGLELGALDEGDLMKILLVGLAGAGRSALSKLGS